VSTSALAHGLLLTLQSPSKVKARVLPSPNVQFGAGSKEATIKPQDMIAGRWRLEYVSPILLSSSWID
jgi:eukaryotic translation initiation factor 2C